MFRDGDRVSIIIPTLNEGKDLGRTLHHLALLNPPPWEVIVIDGGSQDNTVAIAQTHFDTTLHDISTHLVESPCGRSIQMNRGARVATGDSLCFLHADTLMPDDGVALINQTLADTACVGGGFISLMTGKTTTRWVISLHNLLKTYYVPLVFRPHQFVRGLRIFFGDQVMFCRRQDFWDYGGFNESLPLMEDVDLCQRLFRKGRLRLINRVVQSSDRRVVKWGALKANLIYIWIGYLWGIGVSANYLKQFYEDIR